MNCERGSQVIDFNNFQIQTKSAENPSHNIRVLIAPGFGANGRTYTVLMNELNKSGFNVITLNYKYGTKTEPKKFFLPDIDELKQEAIFVAAAQGNIQTSDVVTQVDVVAHSKGAYDVAMVAKRFPQLFRNIIMVAPGGLRPKMKFFEAINTLQESDRQDRLDKRNLLKNGGEIVKLIEQNDKDYLGYSADKLRRTTEGFTSAVKSMKRYLPELRKNEIKIGIICFENDAFYPPESFDEFTRNNVDKFIILPGIHGQIRYSPDVAQTAINLLQEFEPKKSKASIYNA